MKNTYCIQLSEDSLITVYRIGGMFAAPLRAEIEVRSRLLPLPLPQHLYSQADKAQETEEEGGEEVALSLGFVNQRRTLGYQYLDLGDSILVREGLCAAKLIEDICLGSDEVIGKITLTTLELFRRIEAEEKDRLASKYYDMLSSTIQYRKIQNNTGYAYINEKSPRASVRTSTLTRAIQDLTYNTGRMACKYDAIMTGFSGDKENHPTMFSPYPSKAEMLHIATLIEAQGLNDFCIAQDTKGKYWLNIVLK